MQFLSRSCLIGVSLSALVHCTGSSAGPAAPAAGGGGDVNDAGAGQTSGAGSVAPAGTGGRAGAGGASTPAAGMSGAGAGGSSTGTPDAGQTHSGKTLIVGVGSWGYRARSLDGGAFVICQNPSTGNDHSPDLLRDVGYGDGVFIAVGGDANAMVMRSLDGAHWQEDLHAKQGCEDAGYPSSCNNWMGAVAYQDGVWLAGGGNGALMRSTDKGLTWQGVHPSATPSPMRHMAAGSGRFVAGADKGAVFVSADRGESWKKFDLWNKPQSEGMRIAHGAGSFIAWGSWWNGSASEQGCFVSKDQGDSWQACAATVANSGSFVHDGTQWIAPASGGYATSADGVAWTMHSASKFPSELMFDGETLYGRSASGLSRGTSPDGMQAISGVKPPDARAWTIGVVYDSNLPFDGVPACSDNG